MKNAAIRNDFEVAISGSEEFKLVTLEPQTRPEEIATHVEKQGFDFIICEFGQFDGESTERLRQIREKVPRTPMLVFTIFTESQAVITEAKCSFFNWHRFNTWSANGQVHIKQAVAKAQEMVAEENAGG